VWVFSTSWNWLSMVSTGLSEFMALWNTIADLAPAHGVQRRVVAA
jgi:hypothetical protein